MRNTDHDHTTHESARRAASLREAMGPGYGFGGPSEAMLCVATRGASRHTAAPRPAH